MSTTTDDLSRQSLTPPADPEIGLIALRGVVLSQVAYWREDDLHVFRSTEYDVIAGHEDKSTAIRMFVETSEDYAEFLADVEGQAPVEDLKLANLILSRLLRAYDAAAAAGARRRKIVTKLRGRGHEHSRGWRHDPSPQT